MKYLRLKSIEEIQEIAKQFSEQKSTGSNEPAEKRYNADLREADGFLWISFDSLLEIFPLPMSFYLSDELLTIYGEIEKKTGVFPVREF